MISLINDYSASAHPQILERLLADSAARYIGYGADPFSESVRQRLRDRFACPSADVHFFIGGTQVNTVAIRSCLRPHQGVIAVAEAHINVHEAGAIEATGHKVLSLPGFRGKLQYEETKNFLESYHLDGTREHMVQPGMIYLSNTTETGMVYTRGEIEALSTLARDYGLFFYLDGARLGSALTSSVNDLATEDLAKFFDFFTIGGTKNGALFGEALMIVNPLLKADFRSIQKQHGALLAKGWLIALQFDELFKDDLYFTLAAGSNRLAEELATVLEELGIPLAVPFASNQLFPILEAELVQQLEHDFAFEKSLALPDGRIPVRFCTSYANTSADITALSEALRHYR